MVGLDVHVCGGRGLRVLGGVRVCACQYFLSNSASTGENSGEYVQLFLL